MATPKKSSCLKIGVEIEPLTTPNSNDLLTDINNELNSKKITGVKVLGITDTFSDGQPDDSGYYYITILLDNPINFKQHKPIFAQKVKEYIINKYTSNQNINKKNITPDNLVKIQAYVDNVSQTKQIVFPYFFEIDESISKFISYIKNNDVKNGNKQLSKILREKIDNRLNKSLKK